MHDPIIFHSGLKLLSFYVDKTGIVDHTIEDFLLSLEFDGFEGVLYPVFISLLRYLSSVLAASDDGMAHDFFDKVAAVGVVRLSEIKLIPKIINNTLMRNTKSITTVLHLATTSIQPCTLLNDILGYGNVISTSFYEVVETKSKQSGMYSIVFGDSWMKHFLSALQEFEIDNDDIEKRVAFLFVLLGVWYV